MDRYLVGHAGGTEPDDDQGMIGRVYVWNGDWIRSPEQVANRDRNPIMKLSPLWGDQPVVHGDIGCFTEITFEHPPT